MASRKPLGKKARPPTVDGASNVRRSLACTQAILPADQATTPSGPSATWSIQRCFGSLANTVLAPSTSVATILPSSPPVTTRLPSAAALRMAPPWIGRRRGSPSAGASTIASSPRTKAAVRPRKCTATMPLPIVIGRVRSTTETVSLPLAAMVLTLFGDAALEAVGDHLAGQVAADENDAAVALLAGLPRPLMIAIENHVHALENEPLIVVFEGENALAAQNIWAFFLHQVLHPGEKFVGIERLVDGECNRLHLLVVIVLEPAVGMRVIVVVIMAVVIMIVMVMMIVFVGTKKIRLEIEDAVEIERIAAEDRIERHLGALRLVQLGVWIDAADARLDIA